MFGRTQPDAVRHRYADIVKPGVQFVQATIESIDPAARSVQTDAGSFDGDIMVVALGADLDPAHTPGLLEGGHEFYTVDGAFAVADVIDNFAGGRVIVGVISTPFKCPPAPSETALLMNDHLIERGLRDALVGVARDAVRPADPAVARGVGGVARRVRRARDRVVPASKPWCAGPGAQRRDRERRRASCDYDLFLGVPHHVAPRSCSSRGCASTAGSRSTR